MKLAQIALLLLFPTLKTHATPFSVDTSTLYVSGGMVGIRTSSPGTNLDVNGNAQFGSGTTKSTFTTTGALSLASNAALTMAGASGNLTAQSSVTASAFFGDASHMTGLPTADVTAAGNNAFTGANSEAGSETFLANSTLTLNSGAYMSVASTAVYTQYIDSNTTPAKNGLYPLIVPKALAEWASTTSSVTVYTAFNVSSISRTAIGEYTVTMLNAMASTSYIIIASVESSANNTDGVSCIPRKRGDKTTTTFKLRCFDNSFTPQDPGNGASFVVFGTQ